MEEPLIAACVGKQDLEGQQRRREADRGMPMAGKSTLNRLELAKAGADPDSPYCKIVADLDGMANLLVDLFLDVHPEPPEEITLDIDPTDLELFGEQLGRHFQKHYDGYCYLPQYVFCGEFLLAAQLRPGDVGAMSGMLPLLQKIATRIRERWPNVRFVVLSRSAGELDGRVAYEDGYCPRGDAENRIKEQKYLFAESLPCEQIRANQIRLYQCSFAYVLFVLLRRFGLAGTEMSQAQCPTIRTRLFKIGSLIRVTTRRVWAHFSSSFPYRELFAQVLANLRRSAAMPLNIFRCDEKCGLVCRSLRESTFHI